MFVNRAILWPAPGNAPALRDILTSAAPPSGERRVVAQRLWGDAPAFTVNTVFDSLADLEAWRRSWRPNPDVAQHFDRPPTVAFWEAPQGVRANPAARFTVRFTYNPAIGKGRELREVVEQRVGDLQAAGQMNNVWVRISGGPLSIALVSAHESLASIEKVRAANLADPATQSFAQRLTPLLAAPLESPEVFELLTTPA